MRAKWLKVALEAWTAWKVEAVTMAEEHTIAMDGMRRKTIYDDIAMRFPNKIQEAKDSKRDRAAYRAARGF